MASKVQLNRTATQYATLEVDADLALLLKVTEAAPAAGPTDNLAGGGAGNVDNGAHAYKVTFVTAEGETEASPASGGVTVADKTSDGKVALTAIPTGTDAVTSRKLYRTKAGGSTYYYLATIADNTTTTYTDNTADASLSTTSAPKRNTALSPRARILQNGNLDNSLVTTGILGVPLNSFRKDGAEKDAVDDAAGSSLLGLADTTGSPLLGNAANGTHKTDYAQVNVVLPADYVAGGALTFRVRAKIDTSLAAVLSKVDLTVKAEGDALGGDICADAAQQVTAAYANYDFTITPTGLVAGDVLNVRLLLDNDDTGGTNNKAMSVTKCWLVYAKN